MQPDPDAIVSFWRNAGPKAWFAKRAGFDDVLRQRFEADHHAAARGELQAWLDAPGPALALVLLLDQLPRNLWRGSPHAFATDGLARAAAQRAITAGHDMATALELRSFFYMPFVHSEAMADQNRGLILFETLERAGGEGPKSAILHRDIIARFGRFPHRNASLGRETSPAEQAFLDGGGFGG